jgi:hypothetical protein
MKVVRVVEYEGDPQDVARHLSATLLSKATVVKPGDVVEGVGPVMAAAGAPKVTIRLLEERLD